MMEIQPSSGSSQILVKNFFKSDCEDCEEEKNPGPKSASDLTTEEQQIVNQLRTRDQEVRAHERAHQAAAGGLAKGAPTFTYETGPDGKRYAVGGEVQIDTSSVSGDPQATIQKAQPIRRAATAPSNPSSQDRAVAAQASKMEAQARQELQKERAEENKVATESERPSETQAANAGSIIANGETSENQPSRPRPTQSTPTATGTGNFLDIFS
jgi:hypothetical protein